MQEWKARPARPKSRPCSSLPAPATRNSSAGMRPFSSRPRPLPPTGCPPCWAWREAFLARHGYAMPPASGEDDSPQAAAVRSRFRKICHQLLAEEWQVKKLFLAHLDGEAWASMRQPALVTVPLPPHGTGQSRHRPELSPAAIPAHRKARTIPVSAKSVKPTSGRREQVLPLQPPVCPTGRAPLHGAGRRPSHQSLQEAGTHHPLQGRPAGPAQEPARAPRQAPHADRAGAHPQGAFPHLQQAPKLSARTINEKYLAFVQVVFSYAVNNGLVEVNPCTGVRAASNTTELEDVSVLPFSKEDLSVIFQRSGLYHPHGCGAVGRLYASKSKLLDYRWLVLLALYTGARIEELAQLDRQDVRQEAGVWFIHIRAEMTTGRRVKNRASIRKVPLHSLPAGAGLPRLRPAGEGTGKLFSSFRTSRTAASAATPFRSGGGASLPVWTWRTGTGNTSIPSGIPSSAKDATAARLPRNSLMRYRDMHSKVSPRTTDVMKKESSTPCLYCRRHWRRLILAM